MRQAPPTTSINERLKRRMGRAGCLNSLQVVRASGVGRVSAVGAGRPWASCRAFAALRPSSDASAAAAGVEFLAAKGDEIKTFQFEFK